MILSTLSQANVRAVIADAILTGVSRQVISPTDLAARYGYDCSGRGGAVANRFKVEGQRINAAAGCDVIAANFPQFAELRGYSK